MADSRLANAQRSRAADAVAVRFNNGYLRLYSGTRPAGPDTAITGQPLHAELRFAATAFVPATDGLSVAGVISSDTNIDLSGTPTWARAYESDGVTPIEDYDVAASGANINIAGLPLAANGQLSISGFSRTQPAQGA